MDKSCLPRRDLTETAFRKYEHVIARGCVEDFEHDTGAMSAYTFIARFNDAKLGFRRYGYESKAIPEDADVTLVQAKPISEFCVYIFNHARAKKGIALPITREKYDERTGQYKTRLLSVPFELPLDIELLTTLVSLMRQQKLMCDLVVKVSSNADAAVLNAFSQEQPDDIAYLFVDKIDDTKYSLYNTIK